MGYPAGTALTLRAVRCRVHARARARRPVEHLERSRYVVMHKPPLGQHGAAGNLTGWIEKVTKPDHGKSVSTSIRARGVRDNGPRPSGTRNDLGQPGQPFSRIGIPRVCRESS